MWNAMGYLQKMTKMSARASPQKPTYVEWATSEVAVVVAGQQKPTLAKVMAIPWVRKLAKAMLISLTENATKAVAIPLIQKATMVRVTQKMQNSMKAIIHQRFGS
jgi:hypothetical protein